MAVNPQSNDPLFDSRILKYRQAAESMMQGDFQIEIPSGEDDIGQLGLTLRALGVTLEKKFLEISVLSTVTEKINAGLILDEVLAHVYDSFRPIIPYDRIGFSLIEDGGKTVRARWAKSDFPVMKITGGYSAPLQGSSLEKIIQTGQPRIINNLMEYLEAHPKSESTQLMMEEGVRSSLACPLIALGKPIGFMFFSSRNPNTYQNLHVEIFKQIAGQLAVIVEKGRLYQQLVELNDLKNKFLGMAAHDLRNPITVVKTYIALILDGYLGDISQQQRDVLSRMDLASETMLSLINTFLDISAIESGKLQLVFEKRDLKEYLSRFFENSQLLAKSKGITLEMELEENLPMVSMDPHRLEQVLGNLVSNAVKFSYPETTVILSARKEGTTQVHISVADQGQGIPSEDLPLIFKDFGRGSTQPTAGEKSTGLGLAISRRIVEAHGGKIWVDSTPGKGSVFTFSLPIK